MDETSAPQDGGSQGVIRSPRIRTAEMAAVELPDGRTIGVRIDDVSASGLRMETSDPIAAGTRARLILRRHDPVDIEVRWTEGLQAGAVFLQAGDEDIP